MLAVFGRNVFNTEIQKHENVGNLCDAVLLLSKDIHCSWIQRCALPIRWKLKCQKQLFEQNLCGFRLFQIIDYVVGTSVVS